MKGWQELAYHPLATLFPGMAEPEFDELVNSIRTRGFDPRHAIVLYEGQVIEGRHRHLAAVHLAAAGVHVVPAFVAFTGKDPFGFVLQENLARRHLSTGQRLACAVLAAERLNVDEWLPSGDIAARFHVGRAYFYAAVKLRERDPDAFEAMRRGDLSMAEAARHSQPIASADPNPQPRTPNPEAGFHLCVADSSREQRVVLNTHPDSASARDALRRLEPLCAPGVRTWIAEGEA
jgi:hypothetical protein